MLYEFIGLRFDKFGNEVYKVKHKPLLSFISKRFEYEVEYVYAKKIYTDTNESVFYSLETFKLVSYYSPLTSYLTKIKRELMYNKTGITLY